jgi:hypothetical protein
MEDVKVWMAVQSQRMVAALLAILAMIGSSEPWQPVWQFDTGG